MGSSLLPDSCLSYVRMRLSSDPDATMSPVFVHRTCCVRYRKAHKRRTVRRGKPVQRHIGYSARRLVVVVSASPLQERTRISGHEIRRAHVESFNAAEDADRQHHCLCVHIGLALGIALSAHMQISKFHSEPWNLVPDRTQSA